jgi:hypothetical protein
MQADGKKLKFSKTLWVQYEGVDTSEEGDQVCLEGRGEDSYVKVFNQYGRLLKLYTFSGGHWTDSETGQAPAGFDETQAGHLSAPAPAMATAKAPAKKPAKKAPAKKPAKKPAAKPKKRSAAAAKSRSATVTAKGTAKKKPAKAVKKKAPAKKKSAAKKAAAKPKRKAAKRR